MKIAACNMNLKNRQFNKSNLKIDTANFKGIVKDKKQRIKLAHVIIHGAASSAFATSAALAQAPGSDYIPLTGITTTMVGSLLKGIYGIPLVSSAYGAACACALGNLLGNGCWRHAIEWIPGIGNYASATTTASLHEASGWALVAFCEHLLEEGKLNGEVRITREDFKKFKSQAEALKKEADKTYGKNPSFESSFKSQRNKVMHTIFNDFAQKNNIDSLYSNNSNVNELVSGIFNVYNIDNASKCASDIRKIFDKTTKSSEKLAVSPDFKKEDKPDKEVIFDSIYKLIYWLVVAQLEQNSKLNKNLNNININEITLAQECVQEDAAKLMFFDRI